MVLETNGLDWESLPSAVAELADREWLGRNDLLGLPAPRILSLSLMAGAEGVVGLSVVSVRASLWLESGRGGRVEESPRGLERGGGFISLRLGPATLLRFEIMEFDRLNPCGICALHLFDTLSDLLNIALCTKPPIPFVGEVERLRSGDKRRWLGEAAGSSTEVSAWRGSSFCASDKCTGEPNPAETDDTEKR